MSSDIFRRYIDVIEEAQQPASGLSVQQLATVSDEALDNAYHYGRSTPGNTFGWQANLMSAAYAKKLIDAGVTDIEQISDAIHDGWNVTAQKFVQDPDQFDDTEKLRQAGKLEAKVQQRAQLMKQNYAQLPEEEKEKDRVVARALLQAINGEQGVAEVSDATLTSYLTKVDADSQKHEKDPTKRSAEKRNKSVAGFSRAFNKLDARKEKVDEIDPNNYDSDEDYYRDLEAGRYQGVPKKPYNPDWDADDEEFMQNWYKKHGLEEGKTFKDYVAEAAHAAKNPVTGDYFAINVREDTLLETWVCEETQDGIVLHADDTMMNLLEGYGWLESEQSSDCDYAIDSDEDEVDVVDQGEYDQEGDMAKDDLHTIVRAARRLNGMLDDNENMPEWVQSKITKAADYIDTAADYIESNKEQEMDEAKYQGREVPLGKPMRGDVKKSKVYVKGPKGNVVKVNFGDPDMKIKKSNPARRKSFRARHNCENPGPRWKARYWSCRAW